MSNIISTFLLGLATIGSFFGVGQVVDAPIEAPAIELGATLPVASASYTLAGSGITSSATSISLTSLTIPQTGYELVDSNFSPTFYATIEPGSRSRQELVSCTTVTQNSDDTATLSGCSRGLLPFSPYTASTTYAFSHGGGSKLIFSDAPQLFNEYGALANDENITGAWTIATTPTADNSIATKSYVDDNVNGGTVSHDQVIEAGTAGETIASGEIVYFDTTQNEWMLADASVTASSTQVRLGIAQGAGTDGGAIANGVLTFGLDTTNVGGTAGDIVYLSDTAGATSTSAGTVSAVLGIIRNSTSFYFAPHFSGGQVLVNDNTFGGDNTFNGSGTYAGLNTFSATTTFNDFVDGTVASSSRRVFTADGSWTKPSKLRYIDVWVCSGGGGGGSSGDETSGGGGGGGGCSNEILSSEALSATSTVWANVGAAGAAGGAGGSSDFGGFLSATGGSGGSSATGGAGGSGSGGDLNLVGEDGQRGSQGASSQAGGNGGNSHFGGGGTSDTAGNNYGGGGGGALADGTGGGSGSNGAAGAAGVIIVREYY